MKNMLHKMLGIVYVLVLIAGCLLPAGTADADYENAEEILRSNLENTGMSLNTDQRVYDFFGKFSGTELDEIESWICGKEEEAGISI